MLGEDFSITNAAIVIGTLVLLDIALSMLKQRSPTLDRILDDSPMVIVDHGELLSNAALVFPSCRLRNQEPGRNVMPRRVFAIHGQKDR